MCMRRMCPFRRSTPKFQTREIPSRTKNECVHSFTPLKHDQIKRMHAFPTEETETDMHQMFDGE